MPDIATSVLAKLKTNPAKAAEAINCVATILPRRVFKKTIKLQIYR